MRRSTALGEAKCGLARARCGAASDGVESEVKNGLRRADAAEAWDVDTGPQAGDLTSDKGRLEADLLKR